MSKSNEISELLNGLSELAEAMGGAQVETEYIPLMNKEQGESMQKTAVPDILPVLPVRNNVLYPGMVLPITLSRAKTVQLVNEANRTKSMIGVFAQKQKESDDPKPSDLHQVGTMATLLRTLKLPNGSTMAILQGVRRIRIDRALGETPYITAQTTPYDDEAVMPENSANRALIGSVRELFSKVAKLSQTIPQESVFAVQNIESADMLVYFIASGLTEVETAEKQALLEKRGLGDRAMLLMQYLNRSKQQLELQRKIANKAAGEMNQQQKEYFLNQQMKAIQEELGGNGGEEIQELKEKAKNKKWPEEIKKHFEKEIQKTERTHSMSPDYSVQLNYLNTLIDLPWDEYSEDNYDLDKAREVLDEDHFGLEKVKERILSYIAVLRLRGDMKAPILCLVGPPGVGKTSLGKSVARALNRPYVRMSLGGLHDESEIRGHRKTYIGAMPGRVIQGMKKAGASNPVFMLDEIDKISGMTVNGDPSAALLELLDPEQNKQFHDNFLEVDYDLSRVLFIATANTTQSIHPALLDRMEIIEVPSYVMDEKLEIAKRHLVPKQIKEHGMTEKDIVFSDAILRYMIGEYTREAGVRRLEKEIAGVVRQRAKYMTSARSKERKTGLKPDKEFLKEALGTPLYTEPAILEENKVGVVTGLAWTAVGGDVLFIEAALAKGKGELSVTGNLGKVMEESITVAHSYIKANAAKIGIKESVFENTRVFLHVPEGATPKDGPSAGIAVFTALASAYLKKPVKRTVAMTGELTLRGRVTPVGGLREKLLAAKRAGITDVVLCKQNKPQVEEIPAMYTEGLKIHYIERAEEALKKSLAGL